MTSPPLDTDAAPSPLADTNATSPARRPSMHNRELSEREIVQMNTELNAGGPSARRASSNARTSFSRRQSASSDGLTSAQHDQDDSNNQQQQQRLQWDEANLYLNEGQMGGKMKIDEPKTPFVHGEGDPMAEDDDDEVGIDPNHLVVDELDKAKVLDGDAPTGSQQQQPPQQKRAKENDIPDLDLGEPEQDVQMLERRSSDGSGRKVSVVEDPDAMDVDSGRHGEGREEDMGDDELKKHRQFEQMRKRHYEMSNVKDLLG